MNKLSFLTDNEIEKFAESQTTKKVVNQKYIGEINLLKIGIKFGAKWMRDQIKQDNKALEKDDLNQLAKKIESMLDNKAKVSSHNCKVGKVVNK